MNAEQLAQDIASLPEAHTILNGMGAGLGPISKRIESAADSIKIHNILKVLDELDRISPPPQGDTTPERVRRVVDELLKLRKDNLTLNRLRDCDCAERQETREILDQVRAAAGKAMGMSEIGTNGMTTLGMVEELAGRLESARRKCDKHEGRAIHAEEELKLLSEKHKDLHLRYKQLQLYAPCEPTGLAPKQEWSIFPINAVGGYRVVRDGEIATPHPVSHATAEAICKELNARGGS